MTLLTSRRSLILGAGASLLAAPAIVRVASLMKVKALKTIDIIHVDASWVTSQFDPPFNYERLLRRQFYYQQIDGYKFNIILGQLKPGRNLNP